MTPTRSTHSTPPSMSCMRTGVADAANASCGTKPRPQTPRTHQHRHQPTTRKAHPMKMTCSQWTYLQDHLPQTPEGTTLWDKIERRTYGKWYQSQVAIALSKAE